MRISDGITPHGHPIYAAGGTGTGGGGTAELKLYVERGVPSMSPVAVDGSLAIGDGSYSAVRGAVTQASGVFTSSGDAQLGSYVLRNITSTSAWTPLFLDGVAQKLIIPANSAMSFIINIIARRTDGSGSEGGVYEIRGGIDRTMTTISTRLIGTVSKTVVSEDNPIWDIRALADGVGGALTLQVRGENGKTIRWVAHIQTIEVKT
jgi:hypothetical protein